MKLEETFGQLFQYLNSTDYTWTPQTPDQLLQLRKAPQFYSPLIQYFGIGVEVDPNEMLNEGIDPSLLQEIRSINPAVSRCGQYLVPHHHWTGQNGNKENYVYFGQETLRLMSQIQSKLEHFIGKRVLDLGSGSGALSFEVASLAKKVLGIELSQQAVDWANATARAHQLPNVSFAQAELGTPQAEAEVQGKGWDIAVFNPPMIIPRKNTATPYRDGGKLGIQLPLLFLDYSRRHLQLHGEVFCLITNPIVQGRSAFFEQMDSRYWKSIEKRCLHSHFNHSLYRKDEYASLGIQRIELWFLHLKKIG